ncbi:NIPSNAP family containing protein [Marinomonas ushuaiensis DSM 15871]|uniref:NIPSNAP family containing protein n=1 Tax=Marinomonas ushuaiensis DSM 15871 TaxID=1122207 RepID=X7EAY6_9GAMM|nr:NIPSNAP family protein [Marinomonas ushuaiensis]ETX12361.1 NIPSNAP family containing protein [Marinomonas ushuaiensis DSM 15871]
MIYDVRTYTCRPGTIKKHLALYEEFGRDVQFKHLGDPLAYLITETGMLNSYIHIWVYDSVEDRAAKRKRMQEDPAWTKFLKVSSDAAYLVSQENRLMTSVSFAEAKR